MMQFNRNPQRDERRRRVLSDEAAFGVSQVKKVAGTAVDKNTGSDAAPRYSDGALRQPSVIDLVPRRPWVIVLALLLAAGVIAGLEALYLWMPSLAAKTTDGRVAAFDLDGEGSLAAWFSSATLAVAAIMAVLVYLVRRHRLDDYHGRYRIWLWAAACWVVMSIDEGGSLHEGFKELMVQVTGSRLMGDGSLWWTAPYLAVLGIVGMRLLIDMRACRSSSAALVGTAICYAGGVVIQLGWLLRDAGARAVMFEEGAEMVGNVLLVLAMTLHARFVILEAGGLLRRRASRSSGPPADKRKKESAATGTVTGKRRTDLEPVEAQARAVARRVEEDLEDEFDEPPARRKARKHRRVDSAEPGAARKLTKAERKALRRQKQRERDAMS